MRSHSWLAVRNSLFSLCGNGSFLVVRRGEAGLYTAAQTLSGLSPRKGGTKMNSDHSLSMDKDLCTDRGDVAQLITSTTTPEGGKEQQEEVCRIEATQQLVALFVGPKWRRDVFS